MNYIYAAGQLLAIYEQKGSTNNMQYIYTDYLGSIKAVSNSSGSLLQVLSYDACLPVRSAAKAGGNRRDPQTGVNYPTAPTNLMFYRGYTGHEHLDGLGLINMNGRVYDPVLAIFLSPDNYVQDHTNSQNFNRYAYCYNNPLLHTDPSGEFIFTALLGPAGAIIDAACWSALIDVVFQGYNLSTGKQEKFNFAELGGAAVGGAVFAGMGLVAPSFTVTSTSFMTNLPTYLGKAGYAGLTGAVSTGAGMFSSDMFDNGQIDYSGEDYLKAMSTAGFVSGALSFAGSMFDYSTWDHLTQPEKIEMLEKKFNVNIQISETGDYGFYDWGGGTTYIEIDPSALTSRGQAFYSVTHERQHLYDYFSWSENELKLPSEGKKEFLEIRAHKVAMHRWSTSPGKWLDRYDLIRSRGPYKGLGYGYKGFAFSFGPDQIFNFFY